MATPEADVTNTAARSELSPELMTDEPAAFELRVSVGFMPSDSGPKLGVDWSIALICWVYSLSIATCCALTELAWSCAAFWSSVIAAGPAASAAPMFSFGSYCTAGGICLTLAAASACRASRSDMVCAASEACWPELAMATSAPWAAPAPWPTHAAPRSAIAL